jgi:hypothetical protein
VNHAGFEIRQIADFVGQVADYLADDVLVSVMACSAAGGDESFGAAPTAGHTYPGQGSFCDRLCRALIDAGKSNAAVWGHTTEGHTTGNCRLRAFASAGSCDAVWMSGAPPSDPGARTAAVAAYVRDHDFGSSEAGQRHGRENLHLALGHPGAQVTQAMSRGSAAAAR